MSQCKQVLLKLASDSTAPIAHMASMCLPSPKVSKEEKAVKEMCIFSLQLNLTAKIKILVAAALNKMGPSEASAPAQGS